MNENLPNWAKGDRKKAPPVIADLKEPAKEPRPALTAAEVHELITELAMNGEGADKRWALNHLKAEIKDEADDRELEPEEVISKLTRIVSAYPRRYAQTALRRAFKGTDVGLDQDGEELPQNLSEFLDRFPHKRPYNYPAGYPKGYPYRGTDDEKKDWIERKSRILIRLEKKAQEPKDANATHPPDHQ